MSEDPQSMKMKFCPHCGQELQEVQEFCPACGGKLTSGPKKNEGPTAVKTPQPGGSLTFSSNPSDIFFTPAAPQPQPPTIQQTPTTPQAPATPQANPADLFQKPAPAGLVSHPPVLRGIRCIHCKGTGACRFCGGTGATNNAPCARCGGTGRCMICQGRGVL